MDGHRHDVRTYPEKVAEQFAAVNEVLLRHDRTIDDLKQDVLDKLINVIKELEARLAVLEHENAERRGE